MSWVLYLQLVYCVLGILVVIVLMTVYCVLVVDFTYDWYAVSWGILVVDTVCGGSQTDTPPPHQCYTREQTHTHTHI